MVPIALSIAARAHLGPEDYLRATDEIKALIQNWFGFAPIGDGTMLFHTTSSGVKGLQVLHSLACIVGAIALLCVTLNGKKKRLIYMAIPYAFLGLISACFFFMNMDIWNAGAFSFYNRFYLVFFDISVMHGPAPVIIYSAIMGGYLYYIYPDLKKKKKIKC